MCKVGWEGDEESAAMASRMALKALLAVRSAQLAALQGRHASTASTALKEPHDHHPGSGLPELGGEALVLKGSLFLFLGVGIRRTTRHTA